MLSEPIVVAYARGPERACAAEMPSVFQAAKPCSGSARQVRVGRAVWAATRTGGGARCVHLCGTLRPEDTSAHEVASDAMDGPPRPPPLYERA